MRQRIKVATTLLVTLLASTATITVLPAAAAPLEPLPATAVRGIWPIPGGFNATPTDDSGWGDAFTSLEAGACGTVIYGAQQNPDTQNRQKRTVTYSNGDVLTLLRGSVTLNVRQESDGQAVPQADVVVSGSVRRVDYATGASFVERKAPGIIAVHTSESAPGPERNAFLDADLPGLAVLKTGMLSEYTAPGASITRLRRTPVSQVNMCVKLGLPDSVKNSPVLVYESEGI
jgi:hypothetical protein